MRDPYSLEAEHGVLGAMMQRPELIDVLADELTPESFYFADNAEVFRAIMAVRSANKAVDFLTVAEQLGALPSETPALAYCCEIVKNTPSIASASRGRAASTSSAQSAAASSSWRTNLAFL